MKGNLGKPKDARADAAPNVRVLKSAQCRSLSGRSTLGYEVGADAGGGIHLRIRSNSGSGCFGGDWVSLRGLQRELARAPGPVTSGTLSGAFAGRSQNTSGFVAAALLGEGLLEPLANARGYAPTDGVEFMREVRRLMDGGASPQASDRAPKKADSASRSAQKAPKKARKARR